MYSGGAFGPRFLLGDVNREAKVEANVAHSQHIPLLLFRCKKLLHRRMHCAHLIKKAGFSHKTAYTGAVTLIQRFGSALNLKMQTYETWGYAVDFK